MSDFISVRGAREHPDTKDLILRNLIADYSVQVLVRGKQP